MKILKVLHWEACRTAVFDAVVLQQIEADLQNSVGSKRSKLAPRNPKFFGNHMQKMTL